MWKKGLRGAMRRRVQPEEADGEKGAKEDGLQAGAEPEELSRKPGAESLRRAEENQQGATANGLLKEKASRLSKPRRKLLRTLMRHLRNSRMRGIELRKFRLKTWRGLPMSRKKQRERLVNWQRIWGNRLRILLMIPGSRRIH